MQFLLLSIDSIAVSISKIKYKPRQRLLQTWEYQQVVWKLVSLRKGTTDYGSSPYGLVTSNSYFSVSSSSIFIIFLLLKFWHDHTSGKHNGQLGKLCVLVTLIVAEVLLPLHWCGIASLEGTLRQVAACCLVLPGNCEPHRPRSDSGLFVWCA